MSMVNLSFSLERFLTLIPEGIKDQTCRPLNPCSVLSDRRSRAFQLANANLYQLWYKQRTPDRIRIGTGKKKQFLFVQMDEFEVFEVTPNDTVPPVRWNAVDQLDQEDFAVRDGFKDFTEMTQFFREQYGHPELMVWMVPRWDFEDGQ